MVSSTENLFLSKDDFPFLCEYQFSSHNSTVSYDSSPGVTDYTDTLRASRNLTEFASPTEAKNVRGCLSLHEVGLKILMKEEEKH